jgi:rSAM/selenodomain-associated transferase 1
VAWFLKAPVRDTVKTRLQSRLGSHGSLRLHRKLVEHTGCTLLGWDQGTVTAWVSGWSGHPGLSELPSRFAIAVQRGADLGARMQSALASGVRSAGQAVIVGSDSPRLTLARIASAFEAMEQGADVVIGPALDGGYYLLGVKGAWPTLFSRMPWGTSRVATLTARRVRQRGGKLAQLPAEPDVDRPDDLAAVPHAWVEPPSLGR